MFLPPFSQPYKTISTCSARRCRDCPRSGIWLVLSFRLRGKLPVSPVAMDKIVYDRYGILLVGLIERRENEGKMFLYGMYP